MSDDLDYEKLDPGIRRTVRWLRSLGYETCDSGDGVTKLAMFNSPAEAFEQGGILNVPHVFIWSTPETMIADARRLLAVIEETFGYPVGIVEATFNPADGEAIISVRSIGDSNLPGAGQ